MCQIIVKYAHYNFSDKVTSSNVQSTVQNLKIFSLLNIKKIKAIKYSHLWGWNKWVLPCKMISDQNSQIHFPLIVQLYFQPCFTCFSPAFLLQQSFIWWVEEGAIITSSSHFGFWCLMICGQAAALYRGLVQLHFNPLVFLAW